jgi:peptidoglycan/xylan/chitin deacetylase (PgdA/CDA1 family)
MAAIGSDGMTQTQRLGGPLAGLRCALTIDDAPTIAAGLHTVADPGRMERIQAILREHRVDQCVAFVRSGLAAGEEARLRAWLDAGYELGNHTHGHARASAVTVPRFLDDVARCHRVLEEAGAFANGRPRYFRYPYLDRGADEESRVAIAAGIARLGYRIAHGSVDSFDHAYEEQLAAAVAAADERGAEAVGRRYVEVAVRSLAFEHQRTRRQLGRPMAHILYLHFGEVTARFLPRILERLASAGVELCGLEEAMADSLYEQFERQPQCNGRVPPAVLPAGGLARLRRRLAMWSERIGLFRQNALGPRWPHLE